MGYLKEAAVAVYCMLCKLQTAVLSESRECKETLNHDFGGTYVLTVQTCTLR